MVGKSIDFRGFFCECEVMMLQCERVVWCAHTVQDGGKTPSCTVVIQNAKTFASESSGFPVSSISGTR